MKQLLTLLPGLCFGASLTIQPPTITLHGKDATQAFIVTYTDQSGYEHDVTAECAPDNFARTSMRAVVVSCRGLKARAAITVKPSARTPGVSFINDISPIFTMSGCAGSNCHGSIRGQRGFKLSLFGNDPKLDYDAIAGGNAGRIDRKQPEKSLLLTKATAETPHGGGFRFAPDSLQYRTIADWIRQGAPYDTDDSVRVTDLKVYPEERILSGKDSRQQLVAVATYSDGSIRDVTHLVQYSSNSPDTVQVDGKGMVKALQTGETAVMVRTMGKAVAARILIASGPTAKDYPAVTSSNYIDDHIFSKLRKLNIRPSPMSTDEQFLRRVYLDTTGMLPKETEAREFLASSDPQKRTRMIDTLLARREAAELWALKFTELFRAGTREAGAKGARIVYDYVRDSFRENKPYDRLVRELLLSQGAHSFDNSSIAGLARSPTSFYNISFDSNAPDHATNVSQLFLGVRIECAKCHNHPWEKWTQDDFYGFAAFFARVGIKEVYENDENATQYMEEGSVEHPKTKKRMEPRFLDGGLVKDHPDSDIREDLARWMASPANPFFAKTVVNRVWKHFMGRGLVEEVDDFRVTNPPTHPALLDALAADLIRHRFDLRHLMRTILNSRAYQLSAEPNDSNRSDVINYSHFVIRRLPAEAMLDSMSQVTGVAEKFAGYPPGTRAMQVYGGGGGYMLASFGRLNRDIICERDSQPDMAQTMHMISGATIQKKISTANIELSVPDDQLIESIFLRALVRRPSEEERSGLLSRIKVAPDRKAAYQDLLWALLNSKEFLYQH
ncbi:MAG TPA: DUF1549 domain-containing protein [Bryobacteraceae bacterium]|nr:DUF1549 domain-containing protein [Bryobacteraceae bacterium]